MSDPQEQTAADDAAVALADAMDRLCGVFNGYELGDSDANDVCSFALEVAAAAESLAAIKAGRRPATIEYREAPKRQPTWNDAMMLGHAAFPKAVRA